MRAVPRALSRTGRGLRKEDVDALIAEAEAAQARAQMSAKGLGRTERLASTDGVPRANLDRARRQAETDERSFKAADARRLGALHGQRREDIDAAISEPRRRGRAEPIFHRQ